jgi:hypothetical protein
LTASSATSRFGQKITWLPPQTSNKYTSDDISRGAENLTILLVTLSGCRNQGSLTDEEGSVQLNSSNKPVRYQLFDTENIIYIFYKTGYLTEEVNCTMPSFSVGLPWQNLHHNNN